MKIVIFGAAGGTGKALVEQALEQGYIVTGFDRHPEALTLQHPNLTMIQGDIFDPEAVENAIKGQDMVFCVLGVKPGVTVPVCSVGTKNIIAGMQKQGVNRFICQSAFAVAALDGGWREVPWIVPLVSPLFAKVRAMFMDHVRQEQFVRQSNLDWIIVRPSRLTDTPRTGKYKVGDPLFIGPNAHIARADVADFMLKQVNSDAYIHKTPRLKY
ncbi:MAG TPA: SDR family oxidoreductase [Ktedonobacteraceae bacterium]|nr:SDR family oxidoreductase [Ktedonobacteraceae bacterium]